MNPPIAPATRTSTGTLAALFSPNAVCPDSETEIGTFFAKSVGASAKHEEPAATEMAATHENTQQEFIKPPYFCLIITQE